MEKERSAEVVLYQPDERTKLEVQLDADTVWLTQAQICELFQKVKSTISYHISNIFKEGELDERVVVRKSRTTTIHGAIPDMTQDVDVFLYNLDVIISVGYRVKKSAWYTIPPMGYFGASSTSASGLFNQSSVSRCSGACG